eukprot:gene18443-24918_t
MQATRFSAPTQRPFTASRVALRPVAAARTAEAPKPKAYHPSPLSQPAPSTYAIVEVGGTQLIVEPGKWYTVNRLAADVGSKIKFGRVLAVKKDGKINFGMPYVEDASVEAEVIEELRGPKIIVYKMKPKKHYRVHQWSGAKSARTYLPLGLQL